MANSIPSRDSLVLLALHFGIDPEYQNIWGQMQAASEAVLRAALEAVSGQSIPTSVYEDPEAARQWIAAQRAARWLPLPILAESVSQPLASLDIPAQSYQFDIHWEDGRTLSFAAQFDSLGKLLPPAHLLTEARPGYHRLSLSLGPRREVYDWVLSPGRIWELPNERASGISVFLPALRSKNNWGIGDFRDLRDFAAQLSGQGFSFLALNPLHALANRRPYNASPYSPLSLLRLNFVYLAVEELPEYARSQTAQKLRQHPGFLAHLAELREASTVDYEGVARSKRLILKWLFREFLRQPDPAFADWRAAREPWLSQFGSYLALWNHLHRLHPDAWIWQDWPAEYRSPDSPATQELLSRLQRQVDFEAWVQWRLESQLEAAARAVRSLGYSLGLYCDLAVACDKAGPDLWANPELFARGLRIGSPPDDFNQNGQDWGFPALRPLAHCPKVLSYFRESLRAVSRSAGVIRLDHVMRLARLYSVPDHFSARDGVYVRDQFLALLHIVALESRRSQTLVVGEDLGTVPEYFRTALESFGIFSYRLVMFEWNGPALKQANDYPRTALCSFTTHDLASFDGYVQAHDLHVRQKLGFLAPSDVSAVVQQRRQNLDAIRYAFQASHPACQDGDPETLFAGLVHFLLATPCRLVLLSLDELLGEVEQMNLPGTTSEHPNWQRKCRVAIEDFASDARFQNRLAAWNAARGGKPHSEVPCAPLSNE